MPDDKIKDISDMVVAGIDVKAKIEEAKKEADERDGIKLNFSLSKNNFINKYSELCEECTDAPPIFHQFMALAVISSILKRKSYIRFGPHVIFPNLFLVIIAPSSTFRKTTVLNIAQRMIYEIDKDFAFPGEFSSEALIENMASNPNRGIFYSEFKTLLGLLKRDHMAGTKALLTELYDGYLRKKITKSGGEFEVREPFLSLFGATTEEWLIDEVKKEDISSGFLARFLFVIANEKTKHIHRPPPMDINKRNKLILMLEELNQLPGMEMELTEEAGVEYDNWCDRNIERCSKSTNGHKEIYSRAEAYVMKFSIIFSISEKEHKISSSSVKNAIKVMEYCISKFEHLISNKIGLSNWGKTKKTILDLIKSRKKAGILRRDLLYISNLKSKELDDIINTLLEQESIKVRHEDTSTKPRTIYLIRNKDD